MNKDHLILETQQTYYEYVENLIEGCQKISDELRTENESEAFKNIGYFAEGIDWMIQVEKAMKNNGFTITSNLNKIRPFLIEINVAMEKKDYVYVADLFEYELQPLFEELLNVKFSSII